MAETLPVTAQPILSCPYFTGGKGAGMICPIWRPICVGANQELRVFWDLVQEDGKLGWGNLQVFFWVDLF
jgi:hypothetical protein